MCIHKKKRQTYFIDEVLSCLRTLKITLKTTQYYSKTVFSTSNKHLLNQVSFVQNSKEFLLV